MTPTFSHKEIEQLLAEADALIANISTDAVHDLEGGQRFQLAKQARALAQLRAETRERLDMTKKPQSDRPGEGMHEAIGAIVKAVKNIGALLS